MVGDGFRHGLTIVADGQAISAVVVFAGEYAGGQDREVWALAASGAPQWVPVPAGAVPAPA